MNTMTVRQDAMRQEAVRWIEHQRKFEKYGLDMRPAAPTPARVRPVSRIPQKDMLISVMLVMLAGMVVISAIIATAQAANVKYETNALMAANVELQGEIENLRVKIKQATNIKTIEGKAQEELGMVNPNPDAFVFLSSEQQTADDFAMLLREQAHEKSVP